MALFRRLLKPVNRVRMAARPPGAVIAAHSQAVLGSRMSLLCRFQEIFHSRFLVLLHTFSPGIADCKIIHRHIVPVADSLFIPLYGLPKILRHTVSLVVAKPKTAFCIRMPLLCGDPVPECSLFIIDFHTRAEVIAVPQVPLGIHIASGRRLFIPVNSLHLICLHAVPIVIAVSQAPLGSGVSLGCRFFIPCHGSRIIPLHAPATFVAVTQLVLGICVAGLCHLSQPARSRPRKVKNQLIIIFLFPNLLVRHFLTPLYPL